MRIDYEDGSYYIGDVNAKRQPHGKGKFVWKSGDSYEGDFKDGRLCGFGTMKWTDGTYQRGEFKDGEAHGVSEWTDDGEVYYGIYDNGLLLDYISETEYNERVHALNGLSTSRTGTSGGDKIVAKSDTSPDTRKKAGADDIKKAPDNSDAKGDNYDKGYKAGYRQGREDRDKELSSDKTFILGRIEGRSLGEKDGYKKGYDEGYKKGKEDEKASHSGEKTYYQGRVDGRKAGEKDGYEKGYNEGYKKGKESASTSSYSSGSSYSSNSNTATSPAKRCGSSGLSGKNTYDPCPSFVPDVRKGKVAWGSYTYEGEYIHDSLGLNGGHTDVPHGRGKYYDNGGKLMADGFFVKGAQEGYGWKRDDDGNIYEGYFSDGRRHGLGSHLSPDGTLTEGIFENGKLDHTFVKQTFKDGRVFEGYIYFSTNDWERGKITYPNGGVYEGDFGHYPYTKGWYHGTYKIGSKTYEGSWNGDFIASRVTLTEYGRKTEIKPGKI